MIPLIHQPLFLLFRIVGARFDKIWQELSTWWASNWLFYVKLKVSQYHQYHKPRNHIIHQSIPNTNITNWSGSYIWLFSIHSPPSPTRRESNYGNHQINKRVWCLLFLVFTYWFSFLFVYSKFKIDIFVMYDNFRFLIII